MTAKGKKEEEDWLERELAALKPPTYQGRPLAMRPPPARWNPWKKVYER